MVDSGKINILVVDDEKIIREGSERILQKEGWNVTTAENGEQGLEYIKSDRFQILLLDLMMPGIKGMEVLKWLQESYPDLLIIVITGYATIENAVEAMKNGAYDFISKPFTPDQLRIVVKRALDKLNLEREAELLRLEQEKSLKDIANEKSKTLTIINYMADGVLVTDHNGYIVLNNPAVVRMLGLQEDSPLGKHLFDWTQNEELSQIVEKVLKMENEKFQGVSQELILQDPPKVFLMAHSAPVRTEHGEILGSVTIFHDITWFKELDRMKSDFVNMVSHELRSPLSAIRQQVSTIVQGLTGAVTKKQNQMLSRVTVRIDGLMNMINNLLDLSRIETGCLVQRKEQITIKEIIEEVVDTLISEIEKKNVDVNVNIEPSLPFLYADRQSMEIIFSNLINNAIKYNREGGTIFISVQTHGGFIEIKVVDTGVGIPEGDLSRIFDKFFRIRSEYTRKVVGSGLGLPLVKAIIEAHLGTITVESVLGKGTTFTVLFPCINM